MVPPFDRSPQPNRLSEHAVARYIERHGKRHMAGAPSPKWVADHVADPGCTRYTPLRAPRRDLDGKGQRIWRVDFLGPLLLVVDSTGLIRTVLP